ncbi:uncharacterized protein LOC142771407 [Rhipicephalus microplus]|uniref:uncharacterized protein LOC142771407 n=1 Tax=Rhipicephalus microplus TaxID=6941 RepID=UPI003F6B4087
MQTELIAAILTLFFTNTLIHTAGTNVKQFFNQMEPIWTVETTHRGHFMCEVDKILEIRPLSISYTRCAFLRRRRCEFQILGVLDPQHMDWMSIFHRGNFQRLERLLFMSLDKSCAVFRVESLTDWNNFYYDLRVINSSVHTRPREGCRGYFSGITGPEPSFNIYKPRCQRLLR